MATHGPVMAAAGQSPPVRSQCHGPHPREHPFDLLLLDLNLPGPNGFQVLQAARREAQVPVLIVSGRGREADKVGALDLGADDYLVKPFGVAELLARVNALLRRVTPGPNRLLPYCYQGLEVDLGPPGAAE